MTPPILLGQMSRSTKSCSMDNRLAFSRFRVHLDFNVMRVGLEHRLDSFVDEIFIPPVACRFDEITQISNGACVPMNCEQFQYLERSTDSTSYICQPSPGILYSLQAFGMTFIFISLLTRWILTGWCCRL
eukprot:Gregarina_sp_Poly_1__5367@NODE_2834_length_1651_cov_333_747475_g1787_i0_p2_GENE_NODE_2834_length_1651_cov_333_747475_g1787_i0NODE_2834_length_1651_cov_333_747475_g1787_i0_p2_ORF_typecomplete_len142_score6_70_NODE_2834_length_1651_cov_333_747475_g1787_i037426